MSRTGPIASKVLTAQLTTRNREDQMASGCSADDDRDSGDKEGIMATVICKICDALYA
jgi:hypothetical protein